MEAKWGGSLKDSLKIKKAAANTVKYRTMGIFQAPDSPSRSTKAEVHQTVRGRQREENGGLPTYEGKERERRNGDG